MRLLPKKQVAFQVAEQRRNQIDEGKKLAEKVDALRKIEADESKSIQEFRQSSLKIVQKEISDLLLEKDSLKKEIIALREKRKSLIPPLEEDVDRFREAQKELDHFRSLLAQKERRIEIIEEEIVVRNEESRQSYAHSKKLGQSTLEEYDEAERLKIQSQHILRENQEKERLVDIQIENREKETQVRERGLISFESTLKLREETIEMKEEEIVQEKIRLLDQRQTLERAMARLNK